MNTKEKKALLKDVQNASHALGRIEDGPHDLSQLLSEASVEMLRNRCLGAMAGLAQLAALITAQIGTDNLDTP